MYGTCHGKLWSNARKTISYINNLRKITKKMKKIDVQMLTRNSFKPFGDVIDEWPEKKIDINDGFTTRVHDLTDFTFFDRNDADGSIK